MHYICDGVRRDRLIFTLVYFMVSSFFSHCKMSISYVLKSRIISWLITGVQPWGRMLEVVHQGRMGGVI